MTVSEQSLARKQRGGMETGTKESCGTWLWGWDFPISLNSVPNSNCISLGSRATNYHKPLLKCQFNPWLFDTDFESQVSPFLYNMPCLAEFSMQNEI